MWLIDTTTLELHQFLGKTPNYAILSHTWADGEVDFQEMVASPRPATLVQKPGFQKIANFCRIVKPRCSFAWADTACIDKRSSAELSEAIASMYNYYSNASLCVIYLADVHGSTLLGKPLDFVQFQASRWFTRGWTL